jgi:serine/threonine protein kinase
VFGERVYFATRQHRWPFLVIFLPLSMFRSQPVASAYSVCWDSLLGQGLNAVYRAAPISANNRPVAIKFIPDSPAARQEAQAMLACQVDSIVRLIEVFEDTLALPQDAEPRRYLAMVMELMRGGELFDRVASLTLPGENTIRLIVRRIGLALHAIHSRGLVHRDVKMENTLLSCDSKDCSNVKLGDFGFVIKAADVQREEILFTLCNASPEQLRALQNSQHGMRLPVPEYDGKSDMWALGIIMFSMLTGYHPFQAPDSNTVAGQKALVRRIRNGKFNIDDEDLNRISPEGQRVLLSLLSMDPGQRPSAEELLSHPWLLAPNAVSPCRTCKCNQLSAVSELPRSPAGVANSPVRTEPSLSPPELRVHVIQNMAFSRLLYVTLPSCDTTVARLAELVASQHAIPVCLQQYIYKGAVLAPDRTLSSCGVGAGSTVFLAVRKPDVQLVPLAESSNALLKRRLANPTS